LAAAWKIRDWPAAVLPTLRPAPPAARASAPAPAGDGDDPGWHDKLLAALSGDQVQPSAVHGNPGYRVLLGAAVVVLYGIAPVVSQIILPQASGRDPQGAFFASILWYAFSALVLARPTASLMRRNWRARARLAQDELRRARSRRPIFYLRSFELDQKIGRVTIVELLTG